MGALRGAIASTDHAVLASHQSDTRDWARAEGMTLLRSSTQSQLAMDDVIWVGSNPIRGRQQSGHRPAVVIASDDHLASVTTLAIVIPVTSHDRGWPNHIRLSGPTGVDAASWAMTEQPRTISRDRVTSVSSRVDVRCLADIRTYLTDFFGL